METKHTPGPWEPDFFTTRVQTQKDGHIVAEIKPEDFAAREEQMCNARLIAAAPELLAALQLIAAEPCDHGPQEFCPREVARAAIAKATGKE